MSGYDFGHENELVEKCERREFRTRLVREAKSTNPFKRWWYFGQFDGQSEFVGYAPYDKWVYRKFMRRLRYIERHGVYIRRGYFKSGDLDLNPMRYRLVNGDVINRFHFKRYLYTSPWDCGDIDEYLVAKLTIVGMYLFKHSHSVCGREDAHEVWMAREKLIKAYYTLEWGPFTDTIDNILKAEEEAFALIGRNHLNWWD